MGHDNVIEINGKRYDAITGNVLGKNRSRVIDGFRHPAKSSKASTPAASASPAAKAAPKATPHTPPEHPHGHHVTAHHPQQSNTLMRRTVHKPTPQLKPAIKPQLPAERPVHLPAVTPKHSVSQVDASRMDRAMRTSKHQHVRRFHPNHLTQTPALFEMPTVAELPVQAAPPILPAKRTSKPHDVFERAIAQATSHERPAHRPKHHTKKKRLTNGLAAVAALLVIGGFIGYLNLSTINIRVASMQAGFSAHMPGYRPVGYEVSKEIIHKPGEVTLSFRSGDSSFSISQRPSDWNSQTLLENSVSLTGSHQTLASKGRTIFVYQGHNATWVDGGILYSIKGNAELSNGDILAIADSF